MNNITIVSELPSDIFSDYLSGKGYIVERKYILNLKYEYKKELHERILLVNINPRLALQVKSQFPKSKVMLINGGGSEKFISFVTIIYGLEDNDYYYFSSWEEFEEVIFSNYPKKEKRLTYNPSNNLFEYAGKPFDSNYFSSRSYSDRIDSLVENLTPISISYLEWLEKWIKEVENVKFYFNFNFQKEKEIKELTFNFEGSLEIDGLLKEGSEISLFIENEEDSEINATVKKIDGNSIKVLFLKKENTFSLNAFSYFKIKMNYLSYKTYKQKDLILDIKEKQDIKWDKWYEISNPLEFLKTRWQNRNGFNTFLYYKNRENLIKLNFSTRSKMILRNDSQINALIECLSPNFFSFIQGPAGTGKTFLASVIIEQFYKMGFVILVTSHTNRGVDNLLIESSKLVNGENIIRLGNNEEKIAFESKKFQKKNKTSNKNQYLNSSIIGCTLDNLSQAERYISEMGFTNKIVTIIDEASKGFFHEMLHAISLATMKVIMIGDDQQIGNLAIPKEALEYIQRENSWKDEDLPILIKEFNNGFFNTIVDDNIVPSVLLNITYRSLKNIADLVSSAFYDSKVICGNFNPKEKGLIVYYDTKDVESAVNQKDGTSSFNLTEVKFLKKKFIQRLVGVVKNGKSIKDFIIITPYQSQVKLFQRELRQDLLYCKSLNGQVTPENIDEILNELVVTVDSVQGGEKDFVFISMVRSNEYNNIGFNNDHRRIRVTFTRAKKEMIVVGDSNTYCNCKYSDIEKIFRTMIPYIKKHGIYEKLKNLN